MVEYIIAIDVAWARFPADAPRLQPASAPLASRCHLPDDGDNDEDDDDDDDDADDDDAECLYHGSPAFDSRRAEHQRSSGRICLSRRRDPGPAPASQLLLCLHITRKSYAVLAVFPKASDPR